MKYKHLTVGDLHLYDREMRTTKKMIENSRVILDKLYEYLVENEDIILLNINGDIQHKTPSNIYARNEVFYWRTMFKKIGKLMRKRFKKFDGYSLLGVSKQDKEKLSKGEIYPIFVTKGNHDIDRDGIHTFYDDLIAEGLIINAQGLLVSVNNKRTFFSYRNYKTDKRTLPKFSKKTDVIALEHDDILHDESLLWRVPNAESKFLKAEDVTEGVDVTILHHIHESVEPLYVGEDKKRVIWQVGSMGRTAYDEGSKRDVGYGALMKFGDVTNFYTVEFDLIPYKEYFSYKKILEQKTKEQEFKDFSLKVEDYEIEQLNYEEDINKLKDVEQEVKEYAIKVMKEIESMGDEL